MPTLLNRSNLKSRRKALRRNQTPAEKLLWEKLKNHQFYGYKFFRQYSVGPFILDFYCPKMKVGIELDGGHHALRENEVYDIERSQFLESKSVFIVRFWNHEVIQNLDGVLLKLKEILVERSVF